MLHLLSIIHQFDVPHGCIDLSMAEELLHFDRIFASLIHPSGLSLSEVMALHDFTMPLVESLQELRL